MLKTMKQHWPVVAIVLAVTVAVVRTMVQAPDTPPPATAATPPEPWTGPSLLTDRQLQGPERALVAYGADLVANTARYLGPQGSVAHLSNGLNCQNCHLDAGRRAWGNNYGAVASTYPKYRDRSGHVESIANRVNDCFERSLNGQALDTTSHEMRAILAYINWLGQAVPAGTKPAGAGIAELPYMNRPADPLKGQQVYTAKCVSCHGTDGQGQLAENGSWYVYPPLWGPHSYNTGAGLYRLSRFAGFVHDNMPFNQSSHHAPALSTEEAWDVAAFVNSQPRPHLDHHHDWPQLHKKPVDYPYGPYSDGFSQTQHKYGPFGPIAAAHRSRR